MNLKLILNIIFLIILYYLLTQIKKNKIENFKNKSNLKNIYFIWFQGFEKMPEICKKCFYSWKIKNPNWNMIFIDNNNLGEFVPKFKLEEFKKIKPIQCYSDIIRLYIIYNYGGLYVDATLYCNLPLDTYIDKKTVENTYVQWDFDSKLPSINFLYSNKVYNKYFKFPETYKLSNSYHKINLIWHKNLKKIRNILLENQMGHSSNNTKPKLGVKCIANSFDIMNEDVDNKFLKDLKMYPYFKLTYKNIPKLNEFNKNSKLIKLLKIDKNL